METPIDMWFLLLPFVRIATPILSVLIIIYWYGERKKYQPCELLSCAKKQCKYYKSTIFNWSDACTKKELAPKWAFIIGCMFVPAIAAFLAMVVYLVLVLAFILVVGVPYVIFFT